MGNEATVRIYRNQDDGSGWLNCVTNVKGITVSGAEGGGPGEEPTVVDTFTIKGPTDSQTAYRIGGENGIKNIEVGEGGKDVYKRQFKAA